MIVGDESLEGAKRAGELAASVGRLFTAQVVLVRVHDSRRAAGVTRRAVEHQIDEEVRKAEEALEERAAELESILPDRPEERRRRRRLCALRAMERLGLLGEEDLIPTLARRPALRWLADEEGARWVILTELGRIGEPGAFEVAVEWALENRPSPEEAKAYVCRFRSGTTGLPEVAETRRNLSQESAVY